MKKYLVLAATLASLNTFARTPDSLNYKLNLNMKKYSLDICDKSPNYAYKIMNDSTIQGRMFEYKDSSYAINVYYYYGIGVTRIEGNIKGDTILIRSNKRLTINGKKTNAMLKYTLFNSKGEIDCQYLGYKKIKQIK